MTSQLKVRMPRSPTKDSLHPVAGDWACFRRESVSSRQHVKFNIRCMMAEAIGKTASHFGRKVFVFRSGNVQNGTRDRLVLVLFPIPGNAAADAEHAAGFPRVGPNESIIQSHRLGESHEQGPRRG